MQYEPIVSVVIPTYNRYKYLKGSLEAIMSIESDELEVVIHDNTEKNDEIVYYLETLRDKRLKYYHLKEHITVSENCDLAVEKAKGKYICLIGDDDAICSDIIRTTKEMDKKNIDTCVFKISKYNWPDLIEKLPELTCFEIPEFEGKAEYIDPKSILFSCLENGVQSISEMPRVYHAIASKEVLTRIKRKTGTFFPGPSPDMANAVGCAIFSRKHIKLDFPIMISGYGEKSTGGMGRKKMHKGSLKDKPWLPDNIEEIWDTKIPKLWMGNTIWPVSAINALNLLGERDLVQKVDYSKINAETLLHDTSSLKKVIACGLSFSEYCRLINHISKRIIKKVIGNSSEKNKTCYQEKKPISIVEAKIIQEEINKKRSMMLEI